MSRPVKKRIIDGLWNAVAATLISFSLGVLWSFSFLTEGHVLPILYRCAAVCAVISAADAFLPGRGKPVFFSVLAAALAGSFFLRIGPVYGMVQGARALFLQWTFAQDTVIFYAEDLRSLFCLVFCVLVYLQVREDAFGSCVFVYALMTALPLVLSQYDLLSVRAVSAPEGIWMALPACMGLVMVLSGQGGRRITAILLAAAVTLCAFLIIPPEGTVEPGMERAAQAVSDYARDLFYTGETRSVFSLYNAGYMPMGDRLGGSASPGGETVLRALTNAEGPLYLKASGCDTYTGMGWQDTLSQRGYLFDGIYGSTEKERVFGKTQIMEIAPATVTVTMLRDDTTTAFSPQRILSFSGENDRMTLFYDLAGDLYIPRDLSSGDRYTVTYLPLSASDPDVVRAAAEMARESDPYWDEITERYLTVSPSVDQFVWDLTAEITQGITDPLEKAKAIQDHLKAHFDYSLETGTPSADEDFVTWFLKTEKKGYCTYFASAMTIMCRMAGIPARYVTGYAAVPSSDGTCIMTSAQAHAWTEICLKGFGWLTMDATASARFEDEYLDLSGEERDRSSDRDGEDGEVPSPAPSPTPEPTEVPKNGSTKAPKASPTAGPTGMPDLTEKDTDSPENKSGHGILLAIVLLIILAATALALRIHFTDPEKQAEKHPDKAAEILYRAAWRACGIRYDGIRPSETWLEYGERMEKLSGLESIRAGCEDYAGCVYAKDHAADPMQAQRILTEVTGQCSRKQKLLLLMGRIIHG